MYSTSVFHTINCEELFEEEMEFEDFSTCTGRGMVYDPDSSSSKYKGMKITVKCSKN